MNWQRAVTESKKNTATREVEHRGFKEIFICYSDGTGIRMVSSNGKITQPARDATPGEINSEDWEPSK